MKVNRIYTVVIGLLGVLLAFLVGYVVATANLTLLSNHSSDALQQKVAFDAQEELTAWQRTSAAKQKLISYVTAISDPNNADYIEPADRIAVFDFDGTLYLEQQYSSFEAMALLNWVLSAHAQDVTPEQRLMAERIQTAYLTNTYTDETTELFKTLSSQVYSGLTREAFMDYIKSFAQTEADGFTKLKRENAFYMPMKELVGYLEAHDFDIYVVSTSDRDVVRALCEQDLVIDSSHIIGTDYAVDVNEAGTQVSRSGAATTLTTGAQKVAAIAREIGKRPVLAFGNSAGDTAMLNYVATNRAYRSLSFVIDHDDDMREYGTAGGDAQLQAAAQANGWQLISVKQDFNVLFSDEVEKSA